MWQNKQLASGWKALTLKKDAVRARPAKEMIEKVIKKRKTSRLTRRVLPTLFFFCVAGKHGIGPKPMLTLGPQCKNGSLCFSDESYSDTLCKVTQSSDKLGITHRE